MTDVICSLRSLGNSFKATEAFLDARKEDDNFRGGKKKVHVAGDFLRQSSSNCSHSSPTLSLGHTVNLSSRDTEILMVLLSKHLCKSSVSSHSESSAHSVHVSRRSHVTSPPLQGTEVMIYPSKFFPVKHEAFSGRPDILQPDTVSGGGTMNVFKGSLHIDTATLRKIYSKEQQTGPEVSR